MYRCWQASVKLLNLLGHHHDWAVVGWHRSCDSLHLHRLLLLLYHHRLLLLRVHGALSLHLSLVVLGHGGWGMSLLCVRVRPVVQHQTLDAGLLRIGSVLQQHGLAGTGSEHEVLVIPLRLLEIFFDCLLGELLLGIGHFAKIGAPSGKAEAYDEVEENDVDDEPPVECRSFFAALIVDSAPELHLDEEHAAANEKVESEEHFGDLFETVRQFDNLEEQEDEDATPKEEDQAGGCLEI